MRLLLFSILFWTYLLPAQDGHPDLSFGNNGVAIIPIGGPEEDAYILGFDQNSQNTIRALVHYYPADSFYYIVSISENGDVDTSFGNDGFLLLPEEYGIYQNFQIVDSDDTMIVSFYTPNGTLKGAMRLLADGSLDLDFGNNGIVEFATSTGTNIVGINYHNNALYFRGLKEEGGNSWIVLEKYTNAGQLDDSFGNNGILEYPLDPLLDPKVSDFHILNDGGILAGYFEDTFDMHAHFIAKFDAFGNLDEAYGDLGVVSTLPIPQTFNRSNLVAYPDGSLLCSYWDFLPSLEYEILTFKLSADGQLDTSFGNQGVNEDFIAILIQENGRFIADAPTLNKGGYYPGYKRFHQNGYWDTSFDFQNSLPDEYWGNHQIKILNSGKLLMISDWPENDWTADSDIILQQYHNSPLGLEDFPLTEVSIAPNPSNDIFQINLSENWQGSINYVVTDISGKQIQNGMITDSIMSLDLAMFDSGMYFLQIENATFKLIKN